MKKNIIIGLFLFLAIISAYIYLNPNTRYDDKSLKERVKENIEKREKTKEIIISDYLIKNEVKIIDAYINSSGYCYVNVSDDGTNRNGYASYICSEIKSKYPEFEINKVRVMKTGTSSHPDRFNAYGILLGESNCN